MLECVFLYVIVPILLADFFSGLFHWIEDRYGDPSWPLIGRLVVQPNLEHHIRPAALCEGTYWHRNSTTIVPSFILAAAFWSWCLPVALAFLVLSQANEVHSWAHQKCNRVIRFLQWCGICQSCKQHKIHHQRPFDQHYCVMTNYLNYPLSLIGFWTTVEAVVQFFTGIKPRPERELA